MKNENQLQKEKNVIISKSNKEILPSLSLAMLLARNIVAINPNMYTNIPFILNTI